MKSLLFAVLFILLAGHLHAGTRVALVSTCGGKAGEELLTLAVVKLSAGPGIEVLERRNVERVLDEQKLLRCGRSEAAPALVVGRILGVEVFASLETVAGEKDALGLVVYDAHTGVKLLDSDLPEGIERAATAVMQAVILGLDKRNRQQAGTDVTTLCVGTVRNATLPRAFDSLCQSVGTLLERRLLDAPNLVVVERRHLEHVNKERALPVTDEWTDLLGSLVTVELELTRGPTQAGLKATALLKDGKGVDIGKVVADSAKANAADLADELTLRIAERVKAQPPQVAADRAKEAERFQREAHYLDGAGEFAAALQAMEAAAALDSTNNHIGVQLGGFLVRQTQELIRDKKSDLEDALSLATRALDVIRTARQSELVDGREILNLDREPETKLCDDQFWRSLFVRLQPTDRTASGWRSFQGDVRHFVVGTLMKRLAARAAVQQYSWAAFTENTQWLLGVMEGLSWTAADWIEGTRQCYDHWLPLNAQFPLSGGWEFESTRLMTRTCYQMQGQARWGVPHIGSWKLEPADLEGLRPVFEQMAGHTNRVIQIYGMAGQLAVDLRQRSLPADVVRCRFEAIRDFNRAACTNQPGKDLRYLYFTALNVIDLACPDAQERDREYQDLFEFMLKQRHLSIWVIWNVIEPNPSVFRQFRSVSGGAYAGFSFEVFPYEFRQRPVEEYPKLVANANRALELYRSGKYTDGIAMWCLNYGTLPAEMAGVMKPIYAKRPDLAPPPPAAPWTAARLLFEANITNGIAELQLATLQGEAICAIGKHKDGSASLVRVPLNGGAPQIIPLRQLTSAPTAFALAGNRLFVGTANSGIFVFSLADSSAVNLTEANGLPANNVHAVAWLDDKLYAGLGGGYLIAYDFKTERTEVIASGRRREKRTVLDDLTPVFSVVAMKPDAPRHRLLFLVGTEPATQCKPMIGLWQLDATTASISQLLQLYRPPADLQMDYRGEFWFYFAGWGSLTECGGPFRGIIRFDPVADKSHLAASWKVVNRPKSRAAKPGPDLTDDGDAAYLPMHAGAPYLVSKDWLWCRLGQNHRLLREEERDDELPELQWQGRTCKPIWRTLDFIGDGSQVLATAADSVWLLTLPEKTSKEKP